MKTALPMSLLALAISVGGAAARELRPEAINTASIASIGAEKPAPADPDPAIVRLQVLLDRAGASPGVIDGLSGENVNKAVAGFEAMNDLPVDGRLDPEVVSRLEGNAPIVESYVVSADDAKGLVDKIPEDYGEKAKMQSLGYTSVAEKLSERFHMGIDLVNALNPASQFAPGDTVWVVTPGPPREGKVKRIEANKKTGQVLAFAGDGSLLAVYPATIGSEDNPAPSGKHKVKGVARMPVYRYEAQLQAGQERQCPDDPERAERSGRHGLDRPDRADLWNTWDAGAEAHRQGGIARLRAADELGRRRASRHGQARCAGGFRQSKFSHAEVRGNPSRSHSSPACRSRGIACGDSRSFGFESRREITQ